MGAARLQQSASHSSSSSPNLPSTRAQRRGSRTTNACEACKKRKTKCSGPDGPCEACQNVETFCHFNARLDTRRKLAYKPSVVQEKQQYILHALFQTLKSGGNDEILKLINMIRSEALPQDIAGCLRTNMQSLQDRGILPFLDVDETDLVSLGLQNLFSHRNGRHSPEKSPANPKITLDGLEELQPRLESIKESDHSTQSSSPSRYDSRMESYEESPTSTVDPTFLSCPDPIDSVSLPDEDISHVAPSLSSHLPTLSPYSSALNSAISEMDPRLVVPCHSPCLTNANYYNQSYLDNCAKKPVFPHSALSTELRNVAHTASSNLHSTSPSDKLFVGCRDDPLGMSANAYALEQLTDFQRAKYELWISQKMSEYQWNVSPWAYGACAIPQYI